MYKSEENPMFRSKFSEDIFKQKYGHEGCETWAKLAKVLVEDVCGPGVNCDPQPELMPREEREELKGYIRDLKFIPGGRYLYYAGRTRKFFNNCGNSQTLFLTRRGFESMGNYTNGDPVEVYSPVSRRFERATMHTHGIQPMVRIGVKRKGKNSTTRYLTFTPDHKWPTTNRGAVTDLRVGDCLASSRIDIGEDEIGFVHGMVFADGNVHHRKKRQDFAHQLRLCGDKAKFVELLDNYTITYPDFANGDPIAYIPSSVNFKELPADGMPLDYVASFIRGWVALDGHSPEDRSWQIHSTNKDAIDFFVKNAPLAGFTLTGDVLVATNPTNFGERKAALYHVRFVDTEQFGEWQVVSVESIGEELAYCPFEPKHNRIVIDHGIDTYQCYLLRAEEDTRQDWADLSWKAESCLMTGGGIGVDYSVYRKANVVLNGTGGVSSGPIPKMKMINEMGRNVMQGGSRRSAIYASLNWRHGDIHDFITSKNWHEMKVPGANKTLADLKALDFNWPAPLDMTNISTNYDTSWYLNFLRTGDVGEVFLKNAEQALSTAEPGFSFNFFDKENETLRNACTEVSSEDDSDVCNLGSVNMGRIESPEEFRRVCQLATKFLVCGTLRAHLPYQKVYDVRAKNRRLGLGLMGIHEWLLKRGHRYECVPELHNWLTIYRGESNDAANKFCDLLGISRPVAKQSIAPTGTIGILAGTTTGIEPVFAVAFKRRYLKEGTKWHYQFVVDSTAQELIDVYGLTPDSIESALDLASDYERRIKFQADIQAYVDMSISSTINLPKWGSRLNNPDKVKDFAHTLAKYAPRLRGFTCYPDGARGGQPMTAIPYAEARENLGREFEESIESHDICSITGHGGSCGV